MDLTLSAAAHPEPARPSLEERVESALIHYLLSLTPMERLEVLRQAVVLESARRAANP